VLRQELEKPEGENRGIIIICPKYISNKNTETCKLMKGKPQYD
jgi:hypothetical protein